MPPLGFMPGETGGIPDFLRKRRPLADEILSRLGQSGAPFEIPPLSSAPPPAAPPANTSSPDFVGPQPPTRLQNLEAQREQMNAPLTRKGALLRAVSELAPIAIGGLLGGEVGAYGAGQGVEQTMEHRAELAKERRGSLQQEIEAERQRQERMAERQLTTETQRQNAETAARSREDIQGLKNELQRGLGDIKANTAQSTFRLNARKLGYDIDNEGNFVPLDKSQLSPQQSQELADKQSLADLRKAQSDLAGARAEYERTRSDPNSPAAKMAEAKFAEAQRYHNLMAQRLGLSQQQFEARTFGTNNGTPIPGALLTEGNVPVGSQFAANVRPTGQERNKGDMAQSAHEQLSDLKDIVKNRPDVFGPIAGRKTDFTVWIGSQDPDAQRFRAARTIAGDHLAGTFGGRSEAALNAIDDAIGHFKDNPAAISAGLDQLDKANQTFLNKGTVRTVGSEAGKKPVYGPEEKRTLKGGGTVRVHKNLLTGKYEEF